MVIDMKHRALPIIIIFLLLLPAVHATLLVSIGYEGFSVVKFESGKSVSNTGTTWTLVDTFTLALPSQRYLDGITVNWTLSYSHLNSDGITSTPYGQLKVVVNGVAVTGPQKTITGPTNYQITISANYLEPFAMNGIEGTNFTIKIYALATGALSGDTVRVTVNNVYVYLMNENYSILSKLRELKYIPPGAENTASALLVNRTEVLLPHAYNLSQGTISFWLKWDGTDSIMLTNDIGIDKNGYLYIKNSEGTVYTLEGVQIPVGKYVPVYIGWTTDGGYIILNTTRIALNWAGNVVINATGNLNNKSATLIDEFKLFDTYIPPDQVVLASQTQTYHIIADGKVITIVPEGGNSLGLIDVTFLGKNYTVLNTTTMGPSSSLVTAPNGTVAIALSRAGISRTYWLGNYSTIAFPAEDAKLIVTYVTVTPEQFDYLTVKTISGQVASRIKLQDNQADFAAVYGAQYIFTFEKENITRSRIYTVATSNLIFYLTTSQLSLQPPLDFQAYYDQNTKLVWILFEDASGTTKWLNITLTGYQNYARAWQIHDFENRTYGLYIMTANATDTDYVQVMLTANINGSIQTFERTVYVGTGGANRAPFPTTLVPPAVVMLTTALLGIFIFPGTAPALMLLGGATSLGILTVLGWIPATPGLIATLTLLGVLALIVYRRG